MAQVSDHLKKGNKFICSRMSGKMLGLLGFQLDWFNLFIHFLKRINSLLQSDLSLEEESGAEINLALNLEGLIEAQRIKYLIFVMTFEENWMGLGRLAIVRTDKYQYIQNVSTHMIGGYMVESVS